MVFGWIARILKKIFEFLSGFDKGKQKTITDEINDLKSTVNDQTKFNIDIARETIQNNQTAMASFQNSVKDINSIASEMKEFIKKSSLSNSQKETYLIPITVCENMGNSIVKRGNIAVKLENAGLSAGVNLGDVAQVEAVKKYSGNIQGLIKESVNALKSGDVVKASELNNSMMAQLVELSKIKKSFAELYNLKLRNADKPSKDVLELIYKSDAVKLEGIRGITDIIKMAVDDYKKVVSNLEVLQHNFQDLNRIVVTDEIEPRQVVADLGERIKAAQDFIKEVEAQKGEIEENLGRYAQSFKEKEMVYPTKSLNGIIFLELTHNDNFIIDLQQFSQELVGRFVKVGIKEEDMLVLFERIYSFDSNLLKGMKSLREKLNGLLLVFQTQVKGLYKQG